jgi:DNA-binding transcriptional regulator YbjK
MAYSKKKLEELALKAIKKEKLTWHDEVVAFLPCSRATYYNKGLDKLDTIKDAINENKLSMKAQMKHKWFKSENATLQIALMKMIANDDEWDKLNTQKSKNENHNTGSINFDFN